MTRTERGANLFFQRGYLKKTTVSEPNRFRIDAEVPSSRRSLLHWHREEVDLSFWRQRSGAAHPGCTGCVVMQAGAAFCREFELAARAA